jgi:hypothetical protein
MPSHLMKGPLYGARAPEAHTPRKRDDIPGPAPEEDTEPVPPAGEDISKEIWLRSDFRHLGRAYVSATLVAGAAVSWAALFAITWEAGWHQVWQGLLDANWPWLVVAPIGVLLSHLGYSLTYRRVARVGEGPELVGRHGT